jgi:carbohydrate-selective porin OprB
LLGSDYSGIEYLLSAYGGMGSLNELILGQSYVDGVLSWNPGHVELNEKFIELCNNTKQLANAIKRSQT